MPSGPPLTSRRGGAQTARPSTRWSPRSPKVSQPPQIGQRIPERQYQGRAAPEAASSATKSDDGAGGAELAAYVAELGTLLRAGLLTVEEFAEWAERKARAVRMESTGGSPRVG